MILILIIFYTLEIHFSFLCNNQFIVEYIQVYKISWIKINKDAFMSLNLFIYIVHIRKEYYYLKILVQCLILIAKIPPMKNYY